MKKLIFVFIFLALPIFFPRPAFAVAACQDNGLKYGISSWSLLYPSQNDIDNLKCRDPHDCRSYPTVTVAFLGFNLSAYCYPQIGSGVYPTCDDWRTHWDTGKHCCAALLTGDCQLPPNNSYHCIAPAVFDASRQLCVIQDNNVWDYLFKVDCGGGKLGINTAVGCIPTDDMGEFLKFILKFAIYASGGIIMLMIISTGYTILTSSGNPEKLQAAKENIIALLSGFAMIAFSLILLRIIGQNILGLPTF